MSSAALRGVKVQIKTPRHNVRAPTFKVNAFSERDKVSDWRTKQMVDAAHLYFVDFLSKGKRELADQLFDDEAVHQDVIWAPNHPSIGPEGLRHLLEDYKTAFPDFFVEIDQISVCDTNTIFCSYRGIATGLGSYHQHKPTKHSSSFTGINSIKFNHDRSKIIEVKVYREAFAEDRMELAAKEMDGECGFRDLRLKRLM